MPFSFLNRLTRISNSSTDSVNPAMLSLDDTSPSPPVNLSSLTVSTADNNAGTLNEYLSNSPTAQSQIWGGRTALVAVQPARVKVYSLPAGFGRHSFSYHADALSPPSPSTLSQKLAKSPSGEGSVSNAGSAPASLNASTSKSLSTSIKDAVAMLYTGISSSGTGRKSNRSSISESSVTSGSDHSASSSYGRSGSSSNSNSLGKKLSANALLPANTLGFPAARAVVNSLPAIGSKATLQLLSPIKSTGGEGGGAIGGNQSPQTDNFKIMMKSLASSYSSSDEQAAASASNNITLGASSLPSPATGVFTSSSLLSNGQQQPQPQQQQPLFDARYGYHQSLSPRAYSSNVSSSTSTSGNGVDLARSQAIQPPLQLRHQAMVPHQVQSLVSQQIQQQQTQKKLSQQSQQPTAAVSVSPYSSASAPPIPPHFSNAERYITPSGTGGGGGGGGFSPNFLPTVFANNFSSNLNPPSPSSSTTSSFAPPPATNFDTTLTPQDATNNRYQFPQTSQPSSTSMLMMRPSSTPFSISSVSPPPIHSIRRMMKSHSQIKLLQEMIDPGDEVLTDMFIREIIAVGVATEACSLAGNYIVQRLLFANDSDSRVEMVKHLIYPPSLLANGGVLPPSTYLGQSALPISALHIHINPAHAAAASNEPGSRNAFRAWLTEAERQLQEEAREIFAANEELQLLHILCEKSGTRCIQVLLEPSRAFETLHMLRVIKQSAYFARPFDIHLLFSTLALVAPSGLLAISCDAIGSHVMQLILRLGIPPLGGAPDDQLDSLQQLLGLKRHFLKTVIGPIFCQYMSIIAGRQFGVVVVKALYDVCSSDPELLADRERIAAAVAADVVSLAINPHGTFIVAHILTTTDNKGDSLLLLHSIEDRGGVDSFGNKTGFLDLAMNKYASNALEKLLQCLNPSRSEQDAQTATFVVSKLLTSSEVYPNPVVALVNSQSGNYVLQAAASVCSIQQATFIRDQLIPGGLYHVVKSTPGGKKLFGVLEQRIARSSLKPFPL